MGEEREEGERIREREGEGREGEEQREECGRMKYTGTTCGEISNDVSVHSQ